MRRFITASDPKAKRFRRSMGGDNDYEASAVLAHC
jgi:hypothetical protein